MKEEEIDKELIACVAVRDPKSKKYRGIHMPPPAKAFKNDDGTYTASYGGLFVSDSDLSSDWMTPGSVGDSETENQDQMTSSIQNHSISVPAPGVPDFQAFLPQNEHCPEPIQMWQFLLELVSKPIMRSIIVWDVPWEGDPMDGELKLRDPDAVFKLWRENWSKRNINNDQRQVIFTS